MKQNDAIIVSVGSAVVYYVVMMILARILMGGFYGMGMGMGI